MPASNFSYIFYMTLFAWIPILIGWIIFHKNISKHLSAVKKLIFTTVLIGIPWDNLSVYYGVWKYDTNQILGFYIILSPIETILLTVSLDLAVAFLAIILYEKPELFGHNLHI